MWYPAAAKERGVDLDYAAACEAVSGMPYADCKRLCQTEVGPDQQRTF
jgi:uncharacterized protein